MKTLLAVGALTGRRACSLNLPRPRTSRSNSSSGTTRSTPSRTMSSKFEAANPGIKVNVTDYTWPDYQDSLVLRFRGDTPTDVIYGGQDWLPAWAAAGFVAPLDEVAPADTLDELKNDMRRLRADRHDLQGQALRPALLRRHDLLHLQQEDPGGRRHRRARHLGGGDRGRREAQGRRHGASDRLRVQSGASELLRRLRRPGLWPRRRTLRRGAEGRSSTTRTTRPSSSSQWLADAYQEGSRAAGDA